VSFLTQCRQALLPGGVLAFNYIVNDKEEWDKTVAAISSVFPNYKLLRSEINRIFVVEG
jgi:spermidine synthase